MAMNSFSVRIVTEVEQKEEGNSNVMSFNFPPCLCSYPTKLPPPQPRHLACFFHSVLELDTVEARIHSQAPLLLIVYIQTLI